MYGWDKAYLPLWKIAWTCSKSWRSAILDRPFIDISVNSLLNYRLTFSRKCIDSSSRWKYKPLTLVPPLTLWVTLATKSSSLFLLNKSWNHGYSNYSNFSLREKVLMLKSDLSVASARSNSQKPPARFPWMCFNISFSFSVADSFTNFNLSLLLKWLKHRKSTQIRQVVLKFATYGRLHICSYLLQLSYIFVGM